MLQTVQQRAASVEDVEKWLLLTMGQTNSCCGTVSEVNLAATRELGILYGKTGQYAAAEQFLERASQLAVQAVGEGSREFASIQIQLGNVYRMSGQMEQAHACLSAAEALCRGKEDWKALFGAALSNLARLARDQQKVQEAVAYAQKSASITGEVPECAVETVHTYVLLAGLYLQMKDIDAAETAAWAGMECAKAETVDRFTRADILNAMGVIRFQREDFSGARNAFVEELSFLKGETAAASKRALLCAYISSCSEKLGELDLAAAFMHRSYEVIREKLGADAPPALISPASGKPGKGCSEYCDRHSRPANSAVPYAPSR